MDVPLYEIQIYLCILNPNNLSYLFCNTVIIILSLVAVISIHNLL